MADTAAAPMEVDGTPVVENGAPGTQVENNALVDEYSKENISKELITTAEASEEGKTLVPPKKVLLRFDDGTVVRFRPESVKDAEVLKPEVAWKEGILNEAHLLRIHTLLCEVHAKLPEEGPLKSVSMSKRSLDNVLEVGQLNSAKKTKSSGFGTPFSTQIASPDVSSGRSMDLPTVGSKLIRFLCANVLKKDAIVFKVPVNGADTPDYYDHIKEPMCFDTISEKLEKGQYSSPKEYYDDVLLICDNCYRYNVEVHPNAYFGPLGVKMENAFLKAWARTPFSQECPPREPRKAPRIPRAPTSKVARALSGRASVGSLPRAKTQNKILMTPEMEDHLLKALNTPEILEANMEAVVNILNQANEMGEDEDGEPSLDLEKVSAPTKRKLYDLVCLKSSNENSAVARPAASSGFLMEDDDYDPEEEDA